MFFFLIHRFGPPLINNVKWVLMTIFITVGIALMLALLINRPFAEGLFIGAVFYFPYILSGIVVGIIWTWIYHSPSWACW
jgi:raffinose/stachyose/melibiose transport system permease protein